MNSEYEVLIFYKFTHLSDPHSVRDWLLELHQKCQLKGRSIVGYEGINCTIEGLTTNTILFEQEFLQDKRFSDTFIKRTRSNGDSFPKISIKVRNEIVTLGVEGGIDPSRLTGKYLDPEELYDWLESGKKFYIIDMRNDYEHAVGAFKGSILPPMRVFKQLPEVIPTIEHLKNETVVTVCTFGIRCEKASAYLLEQGFQDVYQLKGGIGTYMKMYPGKHFAGKLYTFDGRITIGFNDDDPQREVIGTCKHCGKPSEDYVNCDFDDCHLHFICCKDCVAKAGDKVFCSGDCSKAFQTRYRYQPVKV